MSSRPAALHGVRRLIYTSSPSVVFTGHDLEGVDESTPYAEQYDAAYPGDEGHRGEARPVEATTPTWPRSRSART